MVQGEEVGMAAIVLLVLKASIVLSVFAIGLKASFRDVTYFFRWPGQLVRAFLAMGVLMPLFALALILLFDLHPAVQIALFAISVSPIPPIFPNKALKAGGRENYTIGLLVTSAACSVIVIPVAVELLERVVHIPMQMRARTVAMVVATTVFLPLLVGICVRTWAPKLAERLVKPMALTALVLLVLSALPVLGGATGAMLSLIGDGTLLSISTFAVFGFVVGHLLGGPAHDNRPTLALASATRHPAVALAIAHANFPNQRLAMPAVLLYLMVCGVLSAIYLKWVKRHEVQQHPAETKHAVKA
jgi:BASS family bile acid:Na+ symporter